MGREPSKLYLSSLPSMIVPTVVSVKSVDPASSIWAGNVYFVCI